jgi:hypothetical protein
LQKEVAAIDGGNTVIVEERRKKTGQMLSLDAINFM